MLRIYIFLPNFKQVRNGGAKVAKFPVRKSFSDTSRISCQQVCTFEILSQFEEIVGGSARQIAARTWKCQNFNIFSDFWKFLSGIVAQNPNVFFDNFFAAIVRNPAIAAC